MPFKSQAQRKFLFAKHPRIAKEFAAHTPDIKSLPEHVSGKKNSHMKNLKDYKKSATSDDDDRIKKVISQLDGKMSPDEEEEMHEAISDNDPRMRSLSEESDSDWNNEYKDMTDSHLMSLNREETPEEKAMQEEQGTEIHKPSLFKKHGVHIHIHVGKK